MPLPKKCKCQHCRQLFRPDPRQARSDAPGTLRHVIIRGIEKRHIVDDKKDQEDFVSRMEEEGIN